MSILHPEVPILHPEVPIEDRISHLQAWEKQFEKEEMWKKKYDWRCPECGGQMYNCGEIKKSKFGKSVV